MDIEQQKTVVVDAAERMKGKDITLLDVAEVTSMTDLMLIVSGTSDRHAKSIANHIQVSAKEAGMTVHGIEGQETGEWVLIDLGDILVHVMKDTAREYYELEKLWNVRKEKNAQVA